MKIILVNIVLSGDNAVVIALACRKLPLHQQKTAVTWGTFGAVILRVVLTLCAIWLMDIPFIQAVGGALLFLIAIKLLKGEDAGEHVSSSPQIGAAIRTIIFADLVMSLDNVLAVAGAASGNITLILLGLAISIPLIILGSNFLMRIMNRFPVIVLIGAAVLGYTSGEMVLHDHAVGGWSEGKFPYAQHLLPFITAIMVVLVGKVLVIWRRSQHSRDRLDMLQ